MTPSSAGRGAKVVVATTVSLAFISFWRAASIVLSDLASSAFYAGGIAEQAVGRSAAWFVLGVMLFSFAVRSLYMESSSMFVRGGVYVVVRDSMGPFLARISVSSLLFDFILTGPISVVTAGQYLAGLLNEFAERGHLEYRVPANYFSAGFGIIVTIYFWWLNIKGVHESSGKALRIMQITTVMVVVFLIWCPLTMLLRGGPAQIPPAPLPHNLVFGDESLGWFKGTFWPAVPAVAVMIAFGHSLLSMSGFETLAQVYREVAYPKLKNLKITANIVCFYAVIATGVITVFASMIIPDDVRGKYSANLLSGLAMHLAGPEFLRLGFHMFVVVVGVLILAGAVNTAIIGANGVMNRIAEDGVLVDWFRHPHSKFGTTHRIIHIIALLQIVTISLSGGNEYVLGEAYAFGVVWSFFLNAVGVLVLRYQRSEQEYRVPFNFKIGKVQIPLGLILTTAVLGTTAIVNLFSKQFATIYGILFTGVLFLVFTVSEQINRRKKQSEHGLEQFNLVSQSEVVATSVHARPGAILVAVREINNLAHLRHVVAKTNMRRHDIVVMTVRQISNAAGPLVEDQLFSDYERQLFSKVVTLAEKEGKTVELLVVPAQNPLDAIVQTAQKLQVSRVVTGPSLRMEAGEFARRIGLAWERLPEPRHPFSLEVISADRASFFVNLGPHPPRLWPEDVERLHNLWLELTNGSFDAKLHHRDLIGVALERFERDLHDVNGRRDGVLGDIRNELSHHQDP